MLNIKEHFKLTAVYTFFAAFPALLQLIVYPLIEGKGLLGATDFGYLAITESIISVASVFCLFGTSSGIARLYYDYNDDRSDYNRLVSSVLTGILGRGLLLLGFSIIFGSFIGDLFSHQELQDFGDYGPLLMISGLNRAIIVMSITLFRHEKRILAFIIVSLASGIMRSAFQVIGVLFFELSFLGYVQGTAIGGGATALGVASYLYFSCGFSYNKTINRGLYSFSRPLFFSDLVFWGLLYIDRFFLIDKPDDLGVYDVALKFAIGIQLIIQGLSSAIGPELFRNLKEGVSKRAQEIMMISNLFVAEAIGIIMICIIPAMLFISVFYETELTLSAGLIAITFVRYIFRVQYQVFSLPVMFSKRTNIIFYINVGVLILNTLLYWVLIPLYSYYGAIMAYFFSNFLQVIIFRFVQGKIIPIKWNSNKVFYFPLGIILTASLLEFLKVYLGINAYLTSTLLIIITFIGYYVIYRKEVEGIWLGIKNRIFS
ncbi:MAG: lipopolysaccharide biosynthesis protein [Bacteroidales bacterium]